MPRIRKITTRQKQLLCVIYDHIASSGYPPTFDEMKLELEIRSNQAIIDFLNSLEGNGYIQRKGGFARGIIILQKGYNAINKPALMPITGVSYAGPMAETFQQDLWTELSDEVKIKQDMFLVEISGDSMVNAGINSGDILVARRTSEFVNGDIVVAQFGEATTVKRFRTQKHAPTRFLKPENDKYDIILFKPDTMMQAKIIGKYIDQNIQPIDPKTKSFIKEAAI